MRKSAGLIERWSRKHAWQERIAAYDRHMASIQAESTEALVRARAAEWLERQQSLREEEWAMSEKCLAAAQALLDRILAKPDWRYTPGDVARLLDTASKLGRMASGLPTDHTEVTGPEGGPVKVEVLTALERVYGEVIEAEVMTNAEPSKCGMLIAECGTKNAEGE